MLYKSATDVKNSHEDRVKSIQALQQAFPQHFNGLKEEHFLNGKAKIGFDAATKSILETARAKAALSKITEEANKIANAEYQIEKIKNANHNEKTREAKEIANRPKRFRDIDPKIRLAKAEKDSDDRAKKAIAAEEQKIKASKNSIESLTKFGGGTNKIAKAMAGDNPTENEPIKSTVSFKAPKVPDNSLKEAEQERLASIARMAQISLEGYAKEVTAVDDHFKQLKKSNIKLLTQQNNIKSNIDSAVSKVEVYNHSQKTAIREKNNLSSETKTYTALAWWLIAVGILITIYLLNKFNIFTLIVGVFK